MKMRIFKDYKQLDAWKRNPRGYAVVKLSCVARLESAETGKRIVLVRVPSCSDKALRTVEKIREVFDIDPNGMRPRLVVVQSSVAESPAAEQFMRRAAAIVEV